MKRKIVFVSALLMAACSTSTQTPTSDAKSADASIGANEFVLSCTPTDPASATIADYDLKISAVHIRYENGEMSLDINPNGKPILFDVDSAHDIEVDAHHIAANWSDEDTFFTVSTTDGHMYTGELTYAEDFLVPIRCVKIVTLPRADADFTLSCTPNSLESATISDYNLVIQEVHVVYERKKLALHINPNGKEEVFSANDSEYVVSNASKISGTWPNDDTLFSAKALDPEHFSAELTYVEDFLVPMTCSKI